MGSLSKVVSFKRIALWVTLLPLRESLIYVRLMSWSFSISARGGKFGHLIFVPSLTWQRLISFRLRSGEG